LTNTYQLGNYLSLSLTQPESIYAYTPLPSLYHACQAVQAKTNLYSAQFNDFTTRIKKCAVKDRFSAKVFTRMCDHNLRDRPIWRLTKD